MMNLHSGNVLVNTKTNKVKIIDFDGFLFDYPSRNEQYFFYLVELFIEEYSKQSYDKQSAMLSDLFNPKYNVFEAIDVVSFGRLVYEMYTGKELKAPYPDEIEYPEMSPEIKEILRLIFPLKNRIKNNSKSYYIAYPDVSVESLLKMSFFSNSDENEIDINRYEKNEKKKAKKNLDYDSTNLNFEFDGLSHIKEEIFNHQKFISQQYAKINSFKN
jgi:hypothetical protein